MKREKGLYPQRVCSLLYGDSGLFHVAAAAVLFRHDRQGSVFNVQYGHQLSRVSTFRLFFNPLLLIRSKACGPVLALATVFLSTLGIALCESKISTGHYPLQVQFRALPIVCMLAQIDHAYFVQLDNAQLV